MMNFQPLEAVVADLKGPVEIVFLAVFHISFAFQQLECGSKAAHWENLAEIIAPRTSEIQPDKSGFAMLQNG